MSGRRQVAWKLRAHHVIDEYERGIRKGRLSQTRLADLLGVSRQTVWRNNEIQARLERLSAPGSHSEGGAERKSSVAQVRDLQVRIGELEAINRRLIQNFIVLCKALDERGLDPIELMGVSAPDLVAAKRDASWR